MAKIYVTPQNGPEVEVEAKPGLAVMEIVRDAFPDNLLALCGGACSCATCHVYVDANFADKFPPLGDMEDQLLEMSDHRQPGSRLSCQLPFTDAADGLRLTIAPDAGD